MACTPEECAELLALRDALSLEMNAIQLELQALEAEATAVELELQTVQQQITDCECGLEANPENPTTGTPLTIEQKARVKMLARLFAMARKNPPAVKDPKQV